MHLLQAEAADGAAVLAAEELHQLVVVRADPLRQVYDGLTQLVEPKRRVVPVRTQVLLAERRHAGEAGVRRLRLHARIAAYGLLLPDPAFLLLLRRRAGRALAGPQVEGLHHGAEDRVLLQVRSAGEEGATLRAAVGVLPGGEQAVLAEVVSAGDGHGTLEGTQTDAAGQLVLQAHQGKGTRVHFGHEEESGEAAEGEGEGQGGETKLNSGAPGKRK